MAQLCPMLRKVLFSCLLLLAFADFAFAESDIRKIGFENFTYQPSCAGEEKLNVTVKNGEFSRETKQEGYEDRLHFSVFSVVYGDIDRDGKDEAIILTSCNTGGTGQFTEGFVYTIKTGQPTLLARIAGGDRAEGGLRTAKVANGFLVIDRNRDEGKGLCCPEFAELVKYQWKGNKLVQIGKPVRHPIGKDASMEQSYISASCKSA